MPTPQDDTLAAQLALRNRQLDLILDLDRLRDTTEDETALLTGAIAVLEKAIPAELILAASVDAETHQLDVRAVLDHASQLDRIDTRNAAPVARSHQRTACAAAPDRRRLARVGRALAACSTRCSARCC